MLLMILSYPGVFHLLLSITYGGAYVDILVPHKRVK